MALCETCQNDACSCDVGITLEHLQDIVNAPQTVSVDGQTVTERSANDIIALDKYVRAKQRSCTSKGNGWGSVGIARAIPPDAAGNNRG